MKYSKNLALFATLFIASSSVNAHNMHHRLMDGAPAPDTIFTIYTFADDEFSSNISIQNYSGTSATDPCSDLTAYGDPIKVKLELDEVGIEFDNKEIIKIWGPAKTCVKSEISVDGNVISTGNIQLNWDANAETYTQATPSNIDVDLDSH